MKITRRTEQEINISELKAAIKEGRGLEVIRPHDEITLALDTGETITPVCGYVGKHTGASAKRCFWSPERTEKRRCLRLSRCICLSRTMRARRKSIP